MQLNEIKGEVPETQAKPVAKERTILVRVKRPDGTEVEVSEEEAVNESARGGRRLLID